MLNTADFVEHISPRYVRISSGYFYELVKVWRLVWNRRPYPRVPNAGARVFYVTLA